MEILDATILGAVQGLTEFLPISSSGHLVVAESLLGLKVESLLTFDIAVHAGTLVAILAYFWRDIINIFKNPKLLSILFFGSLPIVVAGLSFKEVSEPGDFRTIGSVGFFMIVVAIVFLLAEKLKIKKSGNVVGKLDIKKAFVIGLFQAVAIIPGVSRSGMTISGGLLQGLKREEAARFSFLLGAVAIFGAVVLTSKDFIEGLISRGSAVGRGAVFFEPAPMIVGLVVSGVVGYLAIWGLMKFLKNHSLLVFAVYLLLFGGSSLAFALL